MRDRREAAIAHARRVLAANKRALTDAAEIEKTIWGSPAGKKRLADRLVAMLPAHKTYVGPFAGSAAVLFARLLQKLTPEGLERLQELPGSATRRPSRRCSTPSPRTTSSGCTASCT